jgi:hypothetical protein
VGILLVFIQLHDLDIVFLHKVTNPAILNIVWYVTHLNIGATMRETTILARHDFPLSNLISLLSGRFITADYNGLRRVNVYAPSGTARRAERERF